MQSGQEYQRQVPNTVEKAQNGLQLSVIKRHNSALVSLAIVKLLTDACQMFGIEWNGEIMVKTADMITEKYWHLNIEEVAMVLTNGSLGKYGKVYGNFKPMDVMEWIGQYDDNERLSYHVTRNTAQNESHEKYFREVEMKEAKKANALVKQNIERLQAQKEAKKIVENQQ